MKIWIVVADEREALFYDAVNPPRDGIPGVDADPSNSFRLALKITNKDARPDRELESDRPGRAFSSSTGQRHSIDGERSTRRNDQEDFAKRIAVELDRARNAGAVDRIVLGAGPRMLGMIRAALSAPCRALVAAEVAKDLVRFDEQRLREHLPPEALPRPHLRA
jgi:protein required for attachment to host cells